jgi:hypothetical protein
VGVTLSRSCAFCAALTLAAASSASSQAGGDPSTIPYDTPSSWQQAAAVTLVRQLPTDSGYFVLGPLDPAAELPNPSNLLASTLRIITPDRRASRNLTRRLWLPTGGVALEELQPADTLPHPLPLGYPGRFVKGTVAGQPVLLQVFTVQEHRWLLWARRVMVDRLRDETTGPLARYSVAIGWYLAALDSGAATVAPPRASDHGLDPVFDLYAPPPGPVIRERRGYESLLEENRAFSIEGIAEGVYGFVPGPAAVRRLEEGAAPLLYASKDGELALQHRYREYQEAGGRWTGHPVLSAATLAALRPGRYVYAADRYGLIRVSRVRASGGPVAGQISAVLLVHGDPVRAAGELVLEAGADGALGVVELSVRSEEYFFSNLSLTVYEDVERRSDGYVAALGHVLKGLELARVPHRDVLIRKF